ncbi:MAG: TRAP transporter small permease [Chloroflexota bacterium]|nr:TRAP transporter small permease [Chloroflexota bacterium]
MKRAAGILNGLSNVTGYISAGLIIAMMCLMLYEVFMRYVVNRPPALADEISAYMLVMLAYIGVAYAWREGVHIRVSTLVERLPRKPANILRSITLFLALIFTIALSVASYTLVTRGFETGIRSSSSLRVLLAWIQLSIVIGYCLLCIMIAADIVKAFAEIKAGRRIELTPEEAVTKGGG